MKRKWDIVGEEAQRKCVGEVIARVGELESTEIGVIAAQDIIDIVTANLAPDIYNAGVKDAQKVIQKKLQDIEVDLELLEQTS